MIPSEDRERKKIEEKYPEAQRLGVRQQVYQHTCNESSRRSERERGRKTF